MLPWVAHPNVVHFDVRACPERSRRGGNHNYLHNGEENERDHAGTKSDRYFPLQHCTATWLTLNYFRVQYYNDSVEGPSPQTSPYWTIIRAQNILHWPIVFAALCVAALLLVIATHYVGQVIVSRGTVKR